MRGYFLESNLSIETQSCVLKEIVTFTQAFLPLLFQVGFCSSTRDKHWQSELSFFVPGGQLRKSRKCHVVSFTATPHTRKKKHSTIFTASFLLPFETLEKLVSTPSVINKNERKKNFYNAHYDNLFFSPMINDLRHTFFHAPRAAPSSPCLAGFSIKQVSVPLLVVRETVGSWVVVASQWQNTAGQAVHTIASSANKTTTPHSTKGVTSLEAPDQSENAKLNEDLKTWRFWKCKSKSISMRD